MRRFLLAGLILLGLTSCSTRFAYNNLDWLVHWYVDDYIALSRTQRPLFDAHMTRWLSWHRQEELIQYRAQLQQLKTDISDNALSVQRVESHFDEAQEHWFRLRDKLAPDLVAMAKLLSDRQISELYEELARDNRALEREYLSDNADAATRSKRLEQRLKRWLGRLTSTQKSIAADHARELVPNYRGWITHRKKIQQHARSILENRNGDPNFETQLLHLMTHPQEHAEDDYLSVSRENRATYARLIAALTTTLTDKQRSRVVDELQTYIRDIDRLLKRS